MCIVPLTGRDRVINARVSTPGESAKPYWRRPAL